MRYGVVAIALVSCRMWLSPLAPSYRWREPARTSGLEAGRPPAHEIWYCSSGEDGDHVCAPALWECNDKREDVEWSYEGDVQMGDCGAVDAAWCYDVAGADHHWHRAIDECDRSRRACELDRATGRAPNRPCTRYVSSR